MLHSRHQWRNRGRGGRRDLRRAHVTRQFTGHYLAAGGCKSVAERFFGVARVNRFLLEYDTGRAGDFTPLRFVKDKGVVLGFASSKV